MDFAATLRCNAADQFCAVIQCALRVERALFAGKALANDFGVFVD